MTEEEIASQILIACVENPETDTIFTGSTRFFGSGNDEDHVVLLEDVPGHLKEEATVRRGDSGADYEHETLSLRFRHYNILIAQTQEAFDCWRLGTETLVKFLEGCSASTESIIRQEKQVRADYFECVFGSPEGQFEPIEAMRYAVWEFASRTERPHEEMVPENIRESLALFSS